MKMRRNNRSYIIKYDNIKGLTIFVLISDNVHSTNALLEEICQKQCLSSDKEMRGTIGGIYGAEIPTTSNSVAHFSAVLYRR